MAFKPKAADTSAELVAAAALGLAALAITPRHKPTRSAISIPANSSGFSSATAPAVGTTRSPG